MFINSATYSSPVKETNKRHVHYHITLSYTQKVMIFFRSNFMYVHLGLKQFLRYIPKNPRNKHKLSPIRFKVDWLSGLSGPYCQGAVRPNIFALSYEKGKSWTERSMRFFQRLNQVCNLHIIDWWPPHDSQWNIQPGIFVNFGVAGSSALQFEWGAVACLFLWTAEGCSPAKQSQHFHVSPYGMPYAICPPVMSMK